ncbi:MAG: ORF6N domain-containing protein [Flavobacteriaceae bacterium]|jgi:phage regulator Rha-like protein|nr:ORF6N domain-containing protein [Flavobacteriaceae bacterium]
MSNIIKFNQVEDKILNIRNQSVILDSDVAELYGVETRDINKSVKNNPDKFPEGYVFEIDNQELANLRWKISTTNLAKTRVNPKAFTERGLYMLATILKSKKATQTTLEIIDTFAKIRELSRTVAELSESPEEFKQKTLMQKGGEIISDILGEDLKTTDTETSIELNFSVLKFKHTIKRK